MKVFGAPDTARSAFEWMRPSNVLPLPLMSACLSFEPSQFVSFDLRSAPESSARAKMKKSDAS